MMMTILLLLLFAVFNSVKWFQTKHFLRSFTVNVQMLPNVNSAKIFKMTHKNVPNSQDNPNCFKLPFYLFSVILV